VRLYVIIALPRDLAFHCLLIALERSAELIPK
jgi:hypothetical protein